VQLYLLYIKHQLEVVPKTTFIYSNLQNCSPQNIPNMSEEDSLNPSKWREQVKLIESH